MIEKNAVISRLYHEKSRTKIVQDFILIIEFFYAQCGSDTETFPVSILPAKCQR